jgi:hypothetical protein
MAMVRIANHYVELSLVLLNTSATAEIRIESDCTVADSDGKSSTLLPGPDLGRILLTLLDADVSAIRAQGLDLILEFTTGYGCKCIPSRLATSRIAFLLAVT